MSPKVKKYRSYRDAVVGGRNEFIGSPMMSGGEASASGAQSPNREKEVKSSNKKKKSPVVPETPEVRQAAEEVPVDWEAAFDRALTVGQPALVVPAQPEVEGSSALIVTRSLPVLPEHRGAVVKFVREFAWEKLKRRKSPANVPRKMVVKDLKSQLDCVAADAEKLLQLSALIHQRFYAAEGSEVLVENHAIALWCGKILFENDEAYSDSDFVHDDVSEESPSHDGSASSNDDAAADDNRAEGSPSRLSGLSGNDTDAPPRDARSSAPAFRRLLPPNVDGITHEERPAFVEYVLSLQEEPALLDVRVHHADDVTRKRRARAVCRLMERFSISKSDAQRLLQISYLVHRRFRALDDDAACEHIGFAALAGRVVHRGDILVSRAESRRAQNSPPAQPSKPAPPVNTPAHRNVKAPPVGADLERTLARVIQDLRDALPADQAEATVKALEKSKRKLQNKAKPQSSFAPRAPAGQAPADLGRTYRVGSGVGELAREQRQFELKMQQLGARAASRDAPESDLRDSDRLALFNSADQKVLGTLRKVIKGRGEFAHLNSKQKVRALSRVVRQQLHEESLALKRRQGDDDDDDDGSDGSKGDSCGSDSADSRCSKETYKRDSFCDSDSGESSPAVSVTSSSDTESVRSGSVSGSDSNSDSDGDDNKRAGMRRNSVNGFGTPKKKSSSVEKLSRRQLLKLPNSAAARQQLVLLGSDDLPMWKVGSSKFKNGFCWESYLHHKQAFDNYTQHRGRFSERTFRSTIHANLVPVVCASCGFSRSKWSLLSDKKLILGIERVLRPSRSTDFAMELKALKVVREGEEGLQSSYCTYAERFLAKVAEAEDAGRPVKGVVVKAAFKAAIDKEVALKTWFEESRWRGVSHAHARLLRKLREARSWEAISKTVLKAKPSIQGSERQTDTGNEDSQSPRDFRRTPRRRANNTRAGRGSGLGKAGGQGRSRGRARGASDNKRARFNGTNDRANQGRRSGSQDKAEVKRTWQGYDQRGESWHDDSNLFECYKKPCNAPFCQRCARHGHTADTCRVPEGVEGLNNNGYFQEKRPGKVGPRKPPAKLNSTGKRGADEDEEFSDEGNRDEDGESGEGGSSTNRRRCNNHGKAGGRGRGDRRCL